MYNYAKDCILQIYPKAKVSGEPTPKASGKFEMTLKGKEDNLVYSKDKTGKAFEESNATSVMKSLVEAV
jgi:hypothetical protein